MPCRCTGKWIGQLTPWEWDGPWWPERPFWPWPSAPLHPLACWECTDIVLMQVLSSTDEVIANVTRSIDLTDMIFCAHVQLWCKIWRGRWCGRPTMSYIQMISRESGVVVFHAKWHVRDVEKVMVPWRKKMRIIIFCYKMGCGKTPHKLKDGRHW